VSRPASADAGSPSPSWYDVLGVPSDASAEEIRTAWRGAIADLDPTDRRFAVLNQAAEVLLDPARRHAYDAELAPPPVVDAGFTEPPPSRGVAAVPGWLLSAVAVLALMVVAVTAVLWVGEPSAQSVEDDTRAAQSAAERAVVPILSYDARHLRESRAAAEQYLTGDFRTDYGRIFDGLIERNAPRTETVLDAELVRSSIVRSGDDRVQVFLLVNQTRTNKRFKQPQVYKNWVTMTMEKVDGDWLVAGIDT
jgi:Mce-associated membrane protein